MRNFNLKIEPEALTDIQEISDWYDDQQPGIGSVFQQQVTSQIDSLATDPQIYAIRYDQIRCMVVKRFPYMVHFYTNHENDTVEALAVISTDRNPKLWKEKTRKK